MKYRKKPVVIEAMRLTKDSFPDVMAWTRDLGVRRSVRIDYGNPGAIAIKTLEGTMTAELGDWIIRGVKGELYPCKPDIFEATYEPVSEEDTP